MTVHQLRRPNNLREARHHFHDMKQIALAKHLNVTRQTIAAWENGERTPPYDQLEAMAELFGESPDSLMGRVPLAVLPGDKP